MDKPKADLRYRITREKAIDYGHIESLMPGLDPHSPDGKNALKAVHQYLASLGHKGGKIGGKSTSPAKVRAAKRNGKLGGRPPKAKFQAIPGKRSRT
jgi:hypothetical protein